MKKKEISIKIASLGWLCEYAVQILSMKVLWTRRRTSTSLVKMIMASNWPWRLVHPLLVPWVTVRAHKTPHYNRHLWRLFKIKIKFHMDVISHNNIASFHWLTHKASIAFYSFIEGACMHRRADRFFKMSKFLISYVRQFHGYGWIRILVPHSSCRDYWTINCRVAVIMFPCWGLNVFPWLHKQTRNTSFRHCDVWRSLA